MVFAKEAQMSGHRPGFAAPAVIEAVSEARLILGDTASTLNKLN